MIKTMMRGLLFVGAVAALSASAEAAMPHQFKVACEPGRFGHGSDEASARADLKSNADRGPQYRDTYEFNLDARTTKMSWADGMRSQTRAMTGLTEDTIEIYNYRLLTVESVRTFHFPTMINTSVTHFTSKDETYAWAVTEQHCAVTR
ncbi:MAG: hypothetical protein GC190_01790 [Alphaproteobacteria bacterium]|nr:hypothetical protein [Alphaproteobacteria bacterium]